MEREDPDDGDEEEVEAVVGGRGENVGNDVEAASFDAAANAFDGCSSSSSSSSLILATSLARFRLACTTGSVTGTYAFSSHK